MVVVLVHPEALVTTTVKPWAVSFLGHLTLTESVEPPESTVPFTKDHVCDTPEAALYPVALSSQRVSIPVMNESGFELMVTVFEALLLQPN